MNQEKEHDGRKAGLQIAVNQGVVDGQEHAHGDDHPELCDDDPRSTQPIGWETNAIDQRTEDQFSEHPRKRPGEGQRGDLFVRNRIVADEHRDERDGDERPRHALCKVQGTEGPKAGALALLQGSHGPQSHRSPSEVYFG